MEFLETAQIVVAFINMVAKGALLVTAIIFLRWLLNGGR